MRIDLRTPNFMFRRNNNIRNLEVISKRLLNQLYGRMVSGTGEAEHARIALTAELLELKSRTRAP